MVKDAVIRETFLWPRPSKFVIDSSNRDFDYQVENTDAKFDKIAQQLALIRDDSIGISFSFKESPYSNIFDGMFVAYDKKCGKTWQEWQDLPDEYQQRMWKLRELTFDYLLSHYSSNDNLIYAGINFDHEKIPLTGIKLGQSIRIFHEHVSVYSLEELFKNKIDDFGSSVQKADVSDFFIQNKFDKYRFKLSNTNFFRHVPINELTANAIGKRIVPYGLVFEVQGNQKIFSNGEFRKSYNSLLNDFSESYGFARDEFFESRPRNKPVVEENKEMLNEIVRAYKTAKIRGALCDSGNLISPRVDYAYSNAFYFNGEKLYFAMRPRVYCGTGTAEIFGIAMKRFLDAEGFDRDFIQVKSNLEQYIEYMSKHGMNRVAG